MTSPTSAFLALATQYGLDLFLHIADSLVNLQTREALFCYLPSPSGMVKRQSVPEHAERFSDPSGDAMCI
jgi:hypothetical protein